MFLLNTPARGQRKLLKCSRCKQAQYHDKECQKRHYKEHKKTCRQSEAPARQPAATSSNAQPTTSFGDGNTPFVGIDVIDSGGELGRVAIAKQAFSSGDVVLSESPAIVFNIDNHDISELLIHFLDASKLTQEMILDLYHGSDDSHDEIDAQRSFFGQQLQMLDRRDKHLLTVDIALKLYKISMYNSHAYRPNAGAGVCSRLPRCACPCVVRAC